MQLVMQKMGYALVQQASLTMLLNTAAGFRRLETRAHVLGRICHGIGNIRPIGPAWGGCATQGGSFPSISWATLFLGTE